MVLITVSNHVNNPLPHWMLILCKIKLLWFCFSHAASDLASTFKSDEDKSLLSSTSFVPWHLGNESQNAAVRDATCSESAATTLIQGPPGSGKTVTCAEIVHRWLLDSEDPVLLVAETNEGVDNLLKKLLEHDVEQEKMVRFGSSGWKVAKELEPLTFEAKYRQLVADKKDRNRIDRKLAKRILEEFQSFMYHLHQCWVRAA